MHTNAGSKESSQQATVPGFGNVWFHEDAIANIFGFGDLVSKYRITYDSEKEDAFLVHMEHKTVKFTRTPEGLYQFKVPQPYKEELKMNQEEKSNNMIQIVDEKIDCLYQETNGEGKSCKKIVSYCWITYIGSIQSHAQEQHYQELSSYCS